MTDNEDNTSGPKLPVPIVFERNGSVLASSRDVAEYFGKNHKDVLRAIRGLECSTEFNRRNFAPFKNRDLTGVSTSHIEMTRDGFMFLVMGFTGTEAAKLKEAYIARFNAMEAVIHEAIQVVKCSPREARLLFKDALTYAKMGGAKGNQALIAANQITRKVAGINFLEEMGMLHMEASEPERLLTPSDIGVRLGGKSAIWVNQCLAELGLQTGYRDHKGRPYWEMTEQGSEYGRMMDTGKRHGDGSPVQQLKWLSSVIELLRKAG